MSLSDRMDYTGLGYEGQTPYYNLYIDYGGAFQAGADAFYADATSLCPIDTGFLYSTIGSSADGEGMDAYADADYAVYVNDWAGFFDAGWQTALAVADAYCDAVYEDAMIEEYEMIWTEMEEMLMIQWIEIERCYEKLDDLMELIREKEFQISVKESTIMVLEMLPGDFSEEIDRLEQEIMELEFEIFVIESIDIPIAESELQKAFEEYERIEDYYETILAYY